MLPAPHNRLSRPALDSRKAGSRTVSFHMSIEPAFAISTRSEHNDEPPGGGTKCSSNILQAVHIRRASRVVDSSCGRSNCSQEHELCTAPTGTWLSVCVVLRQKCWYEGSSYSCVSAGLPQCLPSSDLSN